MFRSKVLFIGLTLMLTGGLLAACNGADDLAGVTEHTTKVFSVPAHVSVTGPTVEEIQVVQQNLHRTLLDEAVMLGTQAPVAVRLGARELFDLAVQEREQRTFFPGPKLVGVVQPVSAIVDLAVVHPEALSTEPELLDLGAIRAARDGGFVWTTVVRSEGAKALRVHISDMSLPPKTELFVYDAEREAHGPYVGTGPHGTGDFWTPSVNGSEIYVQVRHHGIASREDLVSTWLVIDQIGHIDPSALDLGTNEKYNIGEQCYGAWCTENATCHGYTGGPGGIEKAIAHYQYIKRPYIYICTGGLLADDVGSGTPYFLSANHCLSKQKLANTAEFFFDYIMEPCQTRCGDAEADALFKVDGGADILSTSSTSDYTLMRIKGTLPTGRVFLGWSTAEIAYTDNAELSRLSHPNGGPLAYSTHAVDTSKGTCGSWPRGDWIYSMDTVGATEGGSSGSPVLNAADQVVGQLSGACGTNVGDDCDRESNATVDGAFARYHSQVSQWLGGGGPSCDVDPSVCTGGTICCGGQCVLPACGDAGDCGDGESCTTDTCLNAGLCNASCESTWPDCGLADGCCGPACTPGNDPNCSVCLPAGTSCTSNGECCSNKCRGKPGKKKCR